MSIANRIAETLTRRRRAAREQAVTTLAKPKLTNADLGKLPDLLAAGELTAEQAERLADLQRKAEDLRRAIATGPARLAAVERAVGVLAEHRAETDATKDKRQALEQQLERELEEARTRHRHTRVAESRLAEVEQDIEQITELNGPADLSEVSPVHIGGDGNTTSNLPPYLDLPDAPVAIVTNEVLNAERERRGGVVKAYTDATADERKAAYAEAYRKWLYKADEVWRQKRLAQQEAQRRGKPTPKPGHPDEPMPTPTLPTYADVVKTGKHKGTPDAA